MRYKLASHVQASVCDKQIQKQYIYRKDFKKLVRSPLGLNRLECGKPRK